MAHGSVQSEWYGEGLRFECTLCGACCTGPPGVVLVSDEEGALIAARLGISPEDFFERYTHPTSDGASINELLNAHGYDCVFLDRESDPGKAACSLYEDRPVQCRTFPFWPEHIRSPRDWNRLMSHCEGIGRGDVIPVDEIRISARRHSERYGK